MSLGEAVSDAVHWISNEVRKTFEDPFEETYVVTTTVPLDSLCSWQETPLPLGGEASEHQRDSPGYTPRGTEDANHHAPGDAYSYGDEDCQVGPNGLPVVHGGQRAALHCGDPRNAATQPHPDYSRLHEAPDDAGRLRQDAANPEAPAPFPLDAGINQKIFMFQGDICSLKVDAIMSFTSENLDCRDGLAGKLLAIGGFDLLEEVEQQPCCRSGEARITHAYHMPARHILHTVGPRYNTKYMTAAQNTLNGCYRECMKLLVEKNLRTMAVQCVQSDRKNFPLDELCHTALRSVRRWLERLEGKIDAVVFVAEKPKEAAFYENLLKVYFPRSLREERLAVRNPPPFIGNEYGEIEVEERKIRIGVLGNSRSKANDQQPSSAIDSVSCVSTTSEAASSAAEGGSRSGMRPKGSSLIRRDTSDDDPEDEKILDASDLSFTEARTDIDSERRVNAAAQRFVAGDFAEDGDAVYFRYLREAHAMANCAEFKKIAQYRFVYPAGCDKASRPLIVFCAANFPAKAFDWHHLLLYIISVMDPYIRDRYVLLYVNAEVSLSANNPGILLLKEVLSIYQSKYENTLDQLYVLFPGVLFRAAFSCLWPFISSHVWNTTRFFESIRELDEHLDTRKLNFPQYIYDYDRQVRNSATKSIMNITF